MQQVAKRALWIPVVIVLKVGKLIVLVLAFGVLIILMILNGEDA